MTLDEAREAMIREGCCILTNEQAIAVGAIIRRIAAWPVGEGRLTVSKETVEAAKKALEWLR